MSEIQMMRRAVELFPLTEYTSPSAVRHARRAWLRNAFWMRDRPTSIWVMDNPKPRDWMSYNPVRRK